jgi:hypothetical protein
MKPWEFGVSLLLGIVALGLAVATILLDRSSQRLQEQYQIQQKEIERGANSQQTGNGILQDAVRAAGANANLRAFLKAKGIVAEAAPSAAAAGEPGGTRTSTARESASRATASTATKKGSRK